MDALISFDLPEPPVRLQLLNSPSLRLASGRVLPLERKDAALLALLVLDGPTPRRRAAALLWPDADDHRAAANLRERLSRLRREAGAALVVGQGLLSLAEGVPHDLGDAASEFGGEGGAVAQPGELLAGLDYSRVDSLNRWVTQARERWRASRREQLAERAQRLESEGHIAAALVPATQLALDEPLLEHAHRRVMRLHYLRGDRGAALAAYETLRASLRSELGTIPARETLELARTIESSGPSGAQVLAPLPIQVLRPPRLVGRAAPWALLERAWSEGRPALVSGEPGIGKSRLLGDFADARQVDARVQARPGDVHLPYALLARLVRALAPTRAGALEPWVLGELARVAPELGQPPATALTPLRLVQACERLWVDVPAVLVDDLHFADTATLELLPALAAFDTCWFFGVRSAEVPAALASWLGEDTSNGPLRIELEALDGAAIHDLMASLALPAFTAEHWPATLARHTGGNPLFVLETLRDLLRQGVDDRGPGHMPMSPRVGQLIERRLAQLSPAALRLARVAAVAGPDFDSHLAALVLGLHVVDLADSWTELEQSQVFRDGCFAHDLVQDATRRTLPPAIEGALHALVAEHLSGRAHIDARLALHWAAANRPARAAAAHMAAAQAARCASRRFEERDHLARAADCFDQVADGPAAFAARVQSVDVELLIGSIDGGRLLAERLRADSRSATERVHALLASLKVQRLAAEWAVAETSGRLALAGAQALGDAALVADAGRLYATTLAQLARHEEALALLGQAADAAQRAGNRRQQLDVWSDEGFVLERLRRYEESAAVLERAAALAEELDELTELFTLTSNLASVRARLAQLPLVRRHARHAWQLARRLAHTDSVHAAAAQMHFGLFECIGGNFAEGLPELMGAVASFERAVAPGLMAMAQNHLAFVWMLLGQPARAQVLLADKLDQLTPTTRARRLSLQGRLIHFCDTAATAWAGVLPKEGVDMHMQPVIDLEVARGLAPAEAVTRCDEVLRRCADAGAWSLWMNARLLRLDRLRQFDLPCAARDARELLQDLARLQPVDAYLPEFMWVASQALREADHGGEADAALQSAFAWIQQIALPQVPMHFRDGFLRRNRQNLAICAAAREHGLIQRDRQ